MPGLPLPLIASVILIVFLVRGWLKGRQGAVLGLLALLAAQQAVLFARYDTSIAGMPQVLALIAGMIGPATWLVFDTSARRKVRPLRDGSYLLAGPLVVGALLVAWPGLVDLFLNVWFVGHGIAILVVLARGGDSLTEIRIGAGDRARRLWVAAGVALILTGFVDVGITLALIAGKAAMVPWIVSAGSAVLLAAIAAVSLAQVDAIPAQAEMPTTPADAQDEALMEKLRNLMTDKAAFRDPDLTLGRLARRLHVPAKQLSAAINRATGENVSRLVNSYRVQAACEDLASGHSVTQAMLASGFATKSNFNAEFKRVTGAAPRDWLRDQPVNF